MSNNICFRSPKKYPLSKGVFNLAGTLEISAEKPFILGIGFSEKELTGFQSILKFKDSLDTSIVIDTCGLLLSDDDAIFDEYYKKGAYASYFEKEITDENNITFFGVPIIIENNKIYEYINKDVFDPENDIDIIIKNDKVYKNRSGEKYNLIIKDNKKYIQIPASTDIVGSYMQACIYFINGKKYLIKSALGKINENNSLVPDTFFNFDFLPKSGKIKISIYKGTRMTFQNYNEFERSYEKASSIDFKNQLDSNKEYYIYFFLSDINMLTKVGTVFEPLVCPL